MNDELEVVLEEDEPVDFTEQFDLSGLEEIVATEDTGQGIDSIRSILQDAQNDATIDSLQAIDDDEIVTVYTVKDHKHVVGAVKYEYKAMEPKQVPLGVAVILDEAGLLYVGGMPAEVAKKIKDKKPPTPWKVAKPE